jgi:hypothetical protein
MVRNECDSAKQLSEAISPPLATESTAALNAAKPNLSSSALFNLDRIIMP